MSTLLFILLAVSGLLINFLILLAIVAVVYLAFYVFQKLVMPVDKKIVGILVFIVFIILLVVIISGGSLRFW